MSFANDNTSGSKYSNGSWQLSVLQLLGQISTGVGNIPGVDYETRTTTYRAIAAGPGYSIDDIIVRYDIIDVAAQTLLATIWFNQTTQVAIAAPVPADITPYLPPGNVTVTNPFNLEATQLLIQALLTAIDADTSNLDVALSTRATEATLALLNAKFNSLGQKASAASTPVVLSTEQEVILDAIKTAVEAIDTDTSALNLEATQLLIQALLTTIDADTSNLDVALSTRASESTLNTALTTLGSILAQLDVDLSTRSSEATLLATNALLTAMDAVLDAIKVDTGNMLTSLATEATLLDVETAIDTVRLDTANLDVALSTRSTEATQLLIKAKTDNLDVALSTRATEATLATRATEATLATMLTLGGFQARINTLGQKTSAASTPVVIASDQSAIPVTLPTGISRTPSVALIPAASAGNTTAGVVEVSLKISGNNATVGGVAIPNGTVLTYRADYKDTVGAIAYTTGGGTTILISYLT